MNIQLITKRKNNGLFLEEPILVLEDYQSRDGPRALVFAWGTDPPQINNSLRMRLYDREGYG